MPYLFKETTAKRRRKRIGVVEVEPGVRDVKMMSDHAKGVVRVVRTWELLREGSPDYERAYNEAIGLLVHLQMYDEGLAPKPPELHRQPTSGRTDTKFVVRTSQVASRRCVAVLEVEPDAQNIRITERAIGVVRIVSKQVYPYDENDHDYSEYNMGLADALMLATRLNEQRNKTNALWEETGNA